MLPWAGPFDPHDKHAHAQPKKDTGHGEGSEGDLGFPGFGQFVGTGAGYMTGPRLLLACAPLGV